jgi:hypothetical protein
VHCSRLERPTARPRVLKLPRPAENLLGRVELSGRGTESAVEDAGVLGGDGAGRAANTRAGKQQFTSKFTVGAGASARNG